MVPGDYAKRLQKTLLSFAASCGGAKIPSYIGERRGAVKGNVEGAVAWKILKGWPDKCTQPAVFTLQKKV